MKLEKLTDSVRRRYDDACGTAHGLELVGERWALLVVRELLLGPKRFTDLRVTLGVRYEYMLLPLPQAANAGLDASLQALALPAPLAGRTTARGSGRACVRAPRVRMSRDWTLQHDR